VLKNITGRDKCYSKNNDALWKRLEESVLRQDDAPLLPVSSAAVRASGDGGCPPCTGSGWKCPPCPVSTRASPAKICTSDKKHGSWGLVTCNDVMKLAATRVRGVGNDTWWPPTVNRSWSAKEIKAKDVEFAPACDDQGQFGGPTKAKSWGDWIAAYYGELNQVRATYYCASCRCCCADPARVQTKYTNIVWSNGALDPWSGGGHYAHGDNGGITGEPVQNLTADGSSIALPIKNGGHHLDLMFPTAGDPQSVLDARVVEEKMIRRWCQQHYDSLRNE